MTAFLFPGQASQYVASEILDYDLADVCFNGPEDKLKQTAYTQPAVFAHSCALNMLLEKEGITPQAAAGHSLGEYSALVSSGALDLKSGIKAVTIRSRAMQKDCDNHPGTMAAIIGLDYGMVVELLKSAPGIVVPANYNSPGQVVIAGEIEAVNKACDMLKENGAKRALPIPVGGAYHSPLMDNSSGKMKKLITEDMNFSQFKFPVYSNVNAEAVDEPEKFKPLLANQISSPVLWYPIMRNMYQAGIRKFVEIGPGKVLQGLVKRALNDDNIEITGVDDLNSLVGFLKENVEVKSA
jgi:[acyl-carrier-protein] S-malonyltransferase